MSNVSNVHQFHVLDKSSKALSGQRLVRLIAKKDSKGQYPSENLQGSLCVSVPVLAQDDVENVIDRLMPHVVAMCKDAQDKIIREWRIEHGRNEIPEEAFSIDKVVEYLDSAAAGDRVSVEYLQEWFIDSYASAAQQFIRIAIDGAAPEIVEHKVNVLRDMFAGWSSNRYSPNIPQLRAMIRFGAYLGDDADGRMAGYIARAQKMLEVKEQELSADALGF